MRFINELEQWLDDCPRGYGTLLLMLFCALAIFGVLMLTWVATGMVVWNG